MPPITTGAAILAVGSALINGLSSLFGQSSANRANLQIARETNAQNYKMFQEQLGWTESMWNANNEYNTPAAQAERFKQAGFNPYLMMTEGANSGNADTVSTPSPNPAVTGAPMQSVWNDHGQISEIINNIGSLIDLKTRAKKNQREIHNLEKSGQLTDAEAQRNLSESKRIEALIEPTVKQLYSQVGLNDAAQLEKVESANLLRMQSNLAKYDLDNIRPAQLKKLNEEIDLVVANAHLTRRNIDKVASDIARNFAEANNLNASAESTRYLKYLIGDELATRSSLNLYNAQPEYEVNEEVGNPQVYQVKRHGKIRTGNRKRAMEFINK